MTAKTYKAPIESTTEGWVLLANASKSHYVRAGRSLCNRWRYFGTTFSSSGWVGREFCAACLVVRQRENLAARYRAEFERVNGKTITVEYAAGWFRLPATGAVRESEFRAMLAGLEARPTK